MYGVKDIVNLFTDRFIGGKEEGSNLYSLMSVYSDELMLLKETNDRIMDWRNIDNAEGKQLDLIGRDLLKPRGTATDAQYRIMLKTKIAQNLADGTINGLINAMSYALQLPKSEILVTELWEVLDMPAALALEALTPEKVKDANFTQQDFQNLLKILVAAGVKLQLLRTIKVEPIEVRLKAYDFDVPYPICNVQQTADALGKMAQMQPTITTKSYVFSADMPICNEFVTAAILSVTSGNQVEVEAETRAVNVLYPRTGTTYTASKESEEK